MLGYRILCLLRLCVLVSRVNLLFVKHSPCILVSFVFNSHIPQRLQNTIESLPRISSMASNFNLLNIRNISPCPCSVSSPWHKYPRPTLKPPPTIAKIRIFDFPLPESILVTIKKTIMLLLHSQPILIELPAI